MSRKMERLIEALRAYRRLKEGYFPLDTRTVDGAIRAVELADFEIDTSPGAQLARLFGADEGMRGYIEQARKLVNLARALTDYNTGVHDALLVVDGHIVE